MKKGLQGVIVVLVIIAVLGLFIFSTYNGLVTSEEAVNSAWSQVENQIQRRLDLIPNLVSTVKGYAAHEESIFSEVTRAREKLIGAGSLSEMAEANQELSGALSRLLAIAENYPQLKADANFRQLSDELAGTENRIAVARMDYNNAVRAYNTKIRRFPTVIFANMFGFERKDYFQADERASEVPKVDFSGESE
ncbi:MAG TPA: LemA family protein [Thermoanaerobacterales bacterium]|uniref:LemA family protein n=1 Tax=Tepidanaerobacter sp. GT38 TaxID=2722793 RepID=UPI0017A48221|nr:LemA family protein [Tepidanaerobacter sp. GT38]MCG1011220.1 LemA family protein [Tepidanaerobacter sp. GT38]HHY42329.1 LemA family protein [Thermoanaerobacterales bacterium]